MPDAPSDAEPRTLRRSNRLHIEIINSWRHRATSDPPRFSLDYNVNLMQADDELFATIGRIKLDKATSTMDHDLCNPIKFGYPPCMDGLAICSSPWRHRMHFSKRLTHSDTFFDLPPVRNNAYTYSLLNWSTYPTANSNIKRLCT